MIETHPKLQQSQIKKQLNNQYYLKCSKTNKDTSYNMRAI